MVVQVSTDMWNALVAARTKGIVVRDFVWFKGRNRETDALESIGICSFAVAVTVDVVNPNNGNVVARTYQPGAGLMTIPPIPSSLKLEERRIRLTFSRLSPAVINAVKVYDVKGEPVEIHRALFDPETMNQVDAAHCRFDGFVRSVRTKRPKVGNDGTIFIEITDHSTSLRSNAVKVSKALFLERDGDRGGDHVNASPRIVWGQEVKVHGRKQPRRRGRLWK